MFISVFQPHSRGAGNFILTWKTGTGVTESREVDQSDRQEKKGIIKQSGSQSQRRSAFTLRAQGSYFVRAVSAVVPTVTRLGWRGREEAGSSALARSG